MFRTLEPEPWAAGPTPASVRDLREEAAEILLSPLPAPGRKVLTS